MLRAELLNEEIVFMNDRGKQIDQLTKWYAPHYISEVVEEPSLEHSTQLMTFIA